MEIYSIFVLVNHLLLIYSAGGAMQPPTRRISKQTARCPADGKRPWSYSGNNGPAAWGERYPDCYGMRQSPIRIDSNNVVTNVPLEGLYFMSYDNLIRNATIRNTGRTVELTIPDANMPAGFMTIMGSLYYPRQIHFHWGCSKGKGSEHIINGYQYAMEMHIIHTTYIGSVEKTAVLSVLFKQENCINAELQHIVNELPKVMYKDTETELPFSINIRSLLPAVSSPFYRYKGSLTTPNCTEGVIWTVLKNPALVGDIQIKEFRKLSSATRKNANQECKISDNVRPTQDLQGRMVYFSQ